MLRGVFYVEMCVLCQEVCFMLRGVSYVKRCVLSQEVCLMSRGVSYIKSFVFCNNLLPLFYPTILLSVKH